ncbi:DUF1904 domain-containing protein [Clostridium aciditolerans]|uniref:DUF1904 domain-containing protein n=1 Tax=Clostridium aciditolerans TaxID=339861 RepID=A0A934HYE5_9CLOT|nr:DUF1904 domain-containing protein [Clostridium aciditolerans]MBI6874309.1 DUF1904 domain-containing protein [Clostridium aciditolerans]
MPQIKVRGVEVSKICSVSTNMIDELENIIGCPRSYFTIECIPSTFIRDGETCEGYPFIEVVWFDRGQEVQDKVAETINNFVHQCGYESIDIFFTVLKENSYYENGQHF